MTSIAAPLPMPVRRPWWLDPRGVGRALSGMSTAVKNKVLEHIVGKTTYTVTAPVYLALCTVVPTAGDTAATITEATYTGYARISIAAADWASASGGSIATSAAKTGGACTAGTSTIIGWALCTSSSGAGDVLEWGTCTSTVISTTQTPPSIANGALSATLT